MRTLMSPVRECFFRVRQLPARRTALRGFQLPRRCFRELGSSLFRFGPDHLEECARRGRMNLAIQTLLAGTATADPVLDRPCFRGKDSKLPDQPAACLVQEVLPPQGYLGM